MTDFKIGDKDRYLATQAYIAGEEPNGRWF